MRERKSKLGMGRGERGGKGKGIVGSKVALHGRATS